MGYLKESTGIGGMLQKWDFSGVTTFVTKQKVKKDVAQRKKIADATAAQTAAARRQQIDLLAQAEAAASEQANLTLRAAAERKAADLADNPLEDADVQLAEKPTETATATRAKKRKQFGFDTAGYSPGAKL